MKSKILFISLALVLALSVGLIGCTGDGGGGGPEPSEKVVIGSSRSMTGAFANIHVCAFGIVGPAYTADVNNRSPNPGIPVGSDYFLMDYKFLNDGSNESTLVSHINTLIDDVNAGTVHTIFGPTCTHFIDVVSPITNDAEVVLVTVEGGATFLKNPGYIDTWPYVFLSLAFSDWYQLPVLGPLLDQYGASDVYTCWQRDAHGQEYMAAAWGDVMQGITGSFSTVGLTSVGNSSVLNSADPAGWANDLVTNIDATNPDVVCLFCYPDEVWAILGAAQSVDYEEPDMWVIGPGGCFGFFGTLGASLPGVLPPSFGAGAHGMMTFSVGNNKTSSAMQELFNSKVWNPELPDPYALLDMWGHPCYWAACQMWEHAVSAVGTVDTASGNFLIDQEDLKNELASYISSNPVPTVLGDTWFTMFGTGGGLIDYKCHTGEIGQWQNGFIEIVAGDQVLDNTYSLVDIGTYLPRYTTTANVTWPWTGWP